MSREGDAPTASRLAQVNFNSAIALGAVALGIILWLLIPTQIAEPPSFLGYSGGGLSPEMFPRIVAGSFVVIGVIYFFASLRMKEAQDFSALSGRAVLNVVVVLAVMIFYVAMLRPLGYVVSSCLAAGFVSLYYGSRNMIGVALVAIAAPVGIFILFTRFLSVSLPPFPGF